MTHNEMEYAIAALQVEIDTLKQAINRMVSTEDNIEFTTSVELMLNDLKDKLDSLELRILNLENRVSALESQ